MSFRCLSAFLLLLAWRGSSSSIVAHERMASAGALPPAIEVADLQDQLENGLRARLPSEFAFIRRVVEMVRADQLPLDLVVGTFQWARRKKPYPFPYFERALRTLAARRGIPI